MLRVTEHIHITILVHFLIDFIVCSEVKIEEVIALLHLFLLQYTNKLLYEENVDAL